MDFLRTVPFVYKKFLIYFFLGLFTFAIMFPASPAFREYPGQDSGVFLYAGQIILDGGLPYLSVWDHKGPLIYYIDALGLALNHNSWWGPWMIEFLFVYLSAVVGFLLLKRLFGILPALVGTVSWLTILPFFIEGGNLTEEYGILFQFLTLCLFFYYEQKENKNYKAGYFFIGVLSSLLFLLKPNLVGLSLAIFLFLVAMAVSHKDGEQTSGKIQYLIAGFFAVVFLFSLIFLLQGNFYHFIDQFLVYNLIYSGTDIPSKFSALKFLFSTFTAFNLFFLIMVSWFFALFFVVQNREEPLYKKILIIILIDLPIELFLISFSGRPYVHYYMTLLPVISVFVGFFVYYITSNFSVSNNPGNAEPSAVYGKILAVVIIFGLCLSPYTYLLIFTQFSDCYNIVTADGPRNYLPYNKIYLHFYQPPITDRYGGLFVPGLMSSTVTFAQNNATESTIRYISDNTKNDDYVLMYGAESAINFITQRQSPTRFVYQYPLYMHGYNETGTDRIFLSEISQNPPELIIVTKNPEIPLGHFDQILINYTFVESYGEWKIYHKSS